MPQVLTPTEQILQAAQQINCQIPLSSGAKCQYKTSEPYSNSFGGKHKEKLDKYWYELLKAQQQSTANYLYKINLFGNAQDVMQVKKEPVPRDLINYRLLHMPCVGGLSTENMFYLLSLLLNLMKLSAAKQKEFMEYFQSQRLLDVEIVQYLQMISRLPNAGLSPQQLKEFQDILQDLREGITSKNYYNAEHIFLKSANEINPYELEYLKNILQAAGRLSSQQFMYLASFVDKLQQLSALERQQYLEFLHHHQIMSFKRYETLVVFMRSKAKSFKQTKLKLLHKEMERLMDFGSYFCQTKVVTKKIEKKPAIIHIDPVKIDKALAGLMTAALPNIVRVVDLKNFLKDLLPLDAQQIEGNLMQLKSLKILTVKRLKFIQHFIVSGKLGKVDAVEKKKLLDVIRKVAENPEGRAVRANWSIPLSKGPIIGKVETLKQATEPEQKPQETNHLDASTTETNKKLPKESGKKVTKTPKKKGVKKRKK